MKVAFLIFAILISVSAFADTHHYAYYCDKYGVGPFKKTLLSVTSDKKLTVYTMPERGIPCYQYLYQAPTEVAGATDFLLVYSLSQTQKPPLMSMHIKIPNTAFSGGAPIQIPKEGTKMGFELSLFPARGSWEEGYLCKALNPKDMKMKPDDLPHELGWYFAKSIVDLDQVCSP